MTVRRSVICDPLSLTLIRDVLRSLIESHLTPEVPSLHLIRDQVLQLEPTDDREYNHL